MIILKKDLKNKAYNWLNFTNGDYLYNLENAGYYSYVHNGVDLLDGKKAISFVPPSQANAVFMDCKGCALFKTEGSKFYLKISTLTGQIVN